MPAALTANAARSAVAPDDLDVATRARVFSRIEVLGSIAAAGRAVHALPAFGLGRGLVRDGRSRAQGDANDRRGL